MRRLSVCAALAAVMSAHAEVTDLTQMGLEQLMELTVVGASKYEQKQSQVAAAAKPALGRGDEAGVHMDGRNPGVSQMGD